MDVLATAIFGKMKLGEGRSTAYRETRPPVAIRWVTVASRATVSTPGSTMTLPPVFHMVTLFPSSSRTPRNCGASATTFHGFDGGTFVLTPATSVSSLLSSAATSCNACTRAPRNVDRHSCSRTVSAWSASMSAARALNLQLNPLSSALSPACTTLSPSIQSWWLKPRWNTGAHVAGSATGSGDENVNRRGA